MRNLFDRRSATLAAFLLTTAACGGGGDGVAPAVALTAAPTTLSPDTPVAVTGGLVQGARSDTNPDVIAFRGIPYAAPPVGDLRWKLRFYDPVVLPALGMVDERNGAAGHLVRRGLGVTTHLYHLIVAPGAELTGHHAGHAGAGLANSHVAEARDFDSIRAHASGREHLVDEMEGAAVAGLVRAQALLAAAIAPWSDPLTKLAETSTDPAEIRRALLIRATPATRSRCPT